MIFAMTKQKKSWLTLLDEADRNAQARLEGKKNRIQRKYVTSKAKLRKLKIISVGAILLPIFLTYMMLISTTDLANLLAATLIVLSLVLVIFCGRMTITLPRWYKLLAIVGVLINILVCLLAYVVGAWNTHAQFTF
jgi:hypothetical protein